MKFRVYTLALAYLLVLVVFLTSCTKSKESVAPDSGDTIAVSAEPEENPEAAEVFENGVLEGQLQDIYFQFENISLTAEFGELMDDQKYFDGTQKDTIVVALGLTAQISGQRYAIRADSSIQHIEIFQNYETSVAISDEGPHLDLTEWKHHVGEWEPLVIADGGFQTAEYTDADFEQFPMVTTDEIVQAVKDASREDDRWVNLAAKCKDPNGYPCGVSISRIMLKFILTYTTGITVERFIVFEVPMGC